MNIHGNLSGPPPETKPKIKGSWWLINSHSWCPKAMKTDALCSSLILQMFKVLSSWALNASNHNIGKYHAFSQVLFTNFEGQQKKHTQKVLVGQILSKPFPFDSEIDKPLLFVQGYRGPPNPTVFPTWFGVGWLVGCNPISLDLYGCQPKNNGTPKSSIKKMGSSMIFTIHFGG